MKWYFVAGSRGDVEMLLEEGVKSILVSYAYFKKGLPGILEERLKKKQVNVMLDSGAYTNFSKPGTVTLEGYSEYLKSYKDLVTEYIVLDDLKRREITLKNYVLMLKSGLDPLIVDHVWFKWEKCIVPIYSSGKKLCWGGLVSRPDGPMGDWAKDLEKRISHLQTNRAWLNICRRLSERHKKANDGKKTNVHLLAVGTRIRKLIPFLDVVDSFDSATWVISPGLGWVFDYIGIGKDGIPQVRRVHQSKVTPEMKAKNKGLDLQTWQGRRRNAIRELKKFYSAIEQFHATESKKGFDHLWNITNGKQEEKEAATKSFSFPEIKIPLDKTVFSSRELWDAGILNKNVVDSLLNPNARLIQSLENELEQGENAIQKVVPDTDASTEEKRSAQKQRSVQYGIEALEGKGERLSYPAAYPKTEVDYGDPVNLMFPIAPEGRARNARTRFKQFADDIYEMDKSKKIVHTRIVERLLKIGSKPSLSEDDPLDMLLDQGLRDRMMERLESSETEKRQITFLPVRKGDSDAQIVFGIVLEPDEVDAQKDTISAEEIEQAAHRWLAKYQDKGLMHERLVNSKIELYESYIAPSGLTIGGKKVKKGTWLLMYHVLDNDLWQKIKSGELTGFSMGGFARRVKPN